MLRGLYPEERDALKVMFVEAGPGPLLAEVARFCHLRTLYVDDPRAREMYAELSERLTDLRIAVELQ